MNILLTDGSPLYSGILQQALRRYRGVRLVHARTQAEALAQVASEHFQFFVISGQLADGDGLELARRLRQGEKIQIEPIILLTSSPTAELSAQAGRAGVTELFRKQDIDELIAFMRHFLEVNQPMRCRLLYVEDAREQRELLAAQLREWGITVDAFASADEAWQEFLVTDYDIVLCDVVLGGQMTGGRLINRIRRLPLPKGGTPIVAVTAFDSPTRRVELFHLGIDDYVPKPVLHPELRARLYSLLTRKQSAERSEQLLQATALGVTVIDEEGCILSMDANARAMFAVDESILCRDFATLWHFAGGAEEAQNLLRRLRAGEALRQVRGQGRRGDGGEFPAELSSLEINPQAGWRQFALLTRDVTPPPAGAVERACAREAVI